MKRDDVMNQLEVRHENTLAARLESCDLIQADVSENSLRVYRRALLELDRWITDARDIFDQLIG